MPKPLLQALVLADHVYQDKTSGKMLIAGTFNRLHVFRHEPPREGAPGAPGVEERPPEAVPGPAGSEQRPPDARRLRYRDICKAGSPWAYVSLTEIHGTVPLELRYVDLSDNNVMLRVEFSVKSDSPLATVEMPVPMPVLPTPHPGAYALELLANGEPLGSHRVIVSETAAGEPGTEQQG